MSPDQTPEILNTNQDTIILKILGLGIKNLQEFELIDRPSE